MVEEFSENRVRNIEHAPFLRRQVHVSNISTFKLGVSIHTVSCVAQYKFQARPIGQQKNPEVEINL